jgi:hypothetical protein
LWNDYIQGHRVPGTGGGQGFLDHRFLPDDLREYFSVFDLTGGIHAHGLAVIKEGMVLAVEVHNLVKGLDHNVKVNPTPGQNPQGLAQEWEGPQYREFVQQEKNTVFQFEFPVGRLPAGKLVENKY